MKKFYIFLILLLMLSGTKAQSCLPDGITFSTQADIDNFQTNYPNCTEIGGDVTIGNWQGSNISNLNGLSVLNSIAGSLNFGGNNSLVNLSGLENLTSIGGNLQAFLYGWGAEAYGNPILTSLTGLNNLTSIGGDFNLWDNDILTSLTGLDNVTSIGGSLSICYNPALISLTGLEGLSSIGGTFIFGGNNSLVNLTGLENLTLIGGSLQTYIAIWQTDGNPTLTSLTGLNNLTSIGGDLSIGASPSLNTLMGLESLTSIGGSFIFGGNNSLVNLTGLENLTSIGGNLKTYFYSNWVSGNPALTSLTGLDNLTSIAGDLLIILNSSLTSLTGLEGVTSIGGSFIFGMNNSLVNLSGLENLTSIGGNLQTYFYIGENVGNPVLMNLTGLNNLTSIGGGLNICYNPALNSLIGLENIEAGSIDSLLIINNSSLSSCSVQSVCNYLAGPNGTIQIYDNALGCNNQQEVEAACGVGMGEYDIPVSQITIYPNPAADQITIEILKSEKNMNGTVKIFGMSGQELIQQKAQGSIAEIKVSSLPKGIYFVRLVNNEKIEFGKFIKE